MQEQWLGYLLDALDEEEHEQLQRQLDAEPELRQRVAALRARLGLPDREALQFAPPPGLAARTCQYVARQAESRQPARPSSRCVAAAPRAGHLSASSGFGSRARSIRWIDAVVAAVIFVAAGAVVAPAIQESRFQARVAQCKENLHRLGLALTAYSDRNHGFFPSVDGNSRAAVAGTYLLKLLAGGYLDDPATAVCPNAPPAGSCLVGQPSPGGLGDLDRQAVESSPAMLSGIYGYHPGYSDHGVVRATKNLRREDFALVSDAPSTELPGYQSLNHDGRGQNVLAEDLHVRFLPSPSPPAWHDAIFTNDDGQCALGKHPNDSVIFPPTAAPLIYVGGRP